MRIGIDVRYLSHGLMGGVHTYETFFVPALISLAKNHQIFLYADTKHPLNYQICPLRSRSAICPGKTDYPASKMICLCERK